MEQFRVPDSVRRSQQCNPDAGRQRRHAEHRPGGRGQQRFLHSDRQQLAEPWRHPDRRHERQYPADWPRSLMAGGASIVSVGLAVILGVLAINSPANADPPNPNSAKTTADNAATQPVGVEAGQIGQVGARKRSVNSGQISASPRDSARRQRSSWPRPPIRPRPRRSPRLRRGAIRRFPRSSGRIAAIRPRRRPSKLNALKSSTSAAMTSRVVGPTTRPRPWTRPRPATWSTASFPAARAVWCSCRRNSRPRRRARTGYQIRTRCSGGEVERVARLDAEGGVPGVDVAQRAVDPEPRRRVGSDDDLLAQGVVADLARARPAPSRGTRAGRRSGRRSPAPACRRSEAW